MQTTIDGFVIVPPMSRRDEKHKEDIVRYLCPSTFAETAAGAWRRHVREHDTHEFSRKVQHYYDRGYRLAKASMTIEL